MTPGGASKGLVVVVDGRQVHDGPAAFSTRRVSGDQAIANVVLVPGVGEILVEDDRCRFVKADGGVSVLSIFEHPGSCAELAGEKLCFKGAAFKKDVVIDVQGCADRNELFLDRVDDITGGGIAPRTLIERCVPVEAADPSYLRVVDVAVEGMDNPWRALRFRFDDDGFGVCFLSGKRGAYRVTVRVEEAGKPEPRDVVVAGDLGDL
ncbi:MAG: hypothetical protein Q8O67_27665 [Deltaproteobacteria bacterium]|nr:hypothetical protein [Deltaproteobacteria bacterium]